MAIVTKKSNKQNFLESKLSFLAQETKVDVATWSRWLNGSRSPTLDTLRCLAESLDMPLLDLIEAFEERRSRTIAGRKSA
ncbi:hypothetical protein C7Y66_10985 [Chroococcidiopsis sp. CCALA 051]|uniref:helix-turn-helix domain-containing protein n=1 Tax=Chroococcidiopsis sp. CCALA 051 TaxID=869949 RepID=UPI000D0D70ED|nr:helix-turn-helix transcriptional regulator [Chroococcidiopsis sp. CCALA 051]MBE9018891.1 helix-turn-helix transcriptional regulator [Chroococcidiopsidales cyanobacterium LEGE 13417]PSM49138.1 hypothetical protein C7Y66_10985 [Chroococcidiopsis sp. CCALA 051]